MFNNSRSDELLNFTETRMNWQFNVDMNFLIFLSQRILSSTFSYHIND